jgi:hypothetical protein
MDTTSLNDETLVTAATEPTLLVDLPSILPDDVGPFLRRLDEVSAGWSVTVAVPDGLEGSLPETRLKVIGHPPAASATTWTLTSADYVNAHELAQQHGAGMVLLLGAEARSLEPDAIRRMIHAVANQQSDLVMPRYTLPPRAGLVNSAILYPISRALFGAAPRFPLAIDTCFSMRMAERLAVAGRLPRGATEGDGLVWAVSEAVSAGFSITQVDAGPRALPQPTGLDLNSVLAQVTGSLFADIETKAAFWQRSRMARVGPLSGTANQEIDAPQDEASGMIEGFRMAYTNLAEIWSLVLPPQTLLGLKRLSVAPAESFTMPDSLWARIVYDFLVAYRLRTINRGHLLGALTPLYLAWVASHLVQTAEHRDYERHIEAVASAFEADKPYLVSRWRWPDRFNP